MIICHLQRLTEWRLNGCVNNDHLQATLAQIRRGQKELCQRGENERKKSESEKRAFKRLENDKETGSRRDNVSKGGRNARKLGLLKLLTFSRWKQLMTTDRYRWQKVRHLMLKDFPHRHHFDNQRKWANITQFNLNRGGGGEKERGWKEWKDCIVGLLSHRRPNSKAQHN